MDRLGYCLLLILLSNASAIAQSSLSKSIRTSFYTYIYRIDETNLESLYKGEELDERILIHPIDSIRTGKKELPVLKKGNYVEVYVARNELHYSLIEKRSAYLKLLDNRIDLQFIVVDTSGNEIKNAQVSIDGRRMDYDFRAGVYHTKRLRKETALVKVKHDGQVNFTEISREAEEERNKFGFPGRRSRQKYKVRQSPVHGVFSGYMVFNKPIYKPEDSVLFKAFILQGKRRKPVKEELSVRLLDLDSKKELGKVKPLHRGSFSFGFFLHDSLKLRLDRNYRVELYSGNKVFYSGMFRYEDYELKSILFNLRGDNEEHTKTKPQTLFFKATDENGLNIMDGRVDLLIRTNSVEQFFKERLFVPDTLWKYTLKLDPIGETKLVLPDSIFPEANIRYSVEAKFLNADNQDKRSQASFRYLALANDELKFDLRQDSLYISFADERISGATYKISAVSAGADTIETVRLNLPAALKINPYAEEYKVEGDSILDWFDVTEGRADLQVQAYRTADSLLVRVDNPRKIPFWYTILKGSRVVDRGRAIELNYTKPFRSSQKTTFRYSYIWADKSVEKSLDVNFAEKRLRVDVSQPLTLSPGEKAEVLVKVTDAKGDPVSDADLTAYAITSKFNYYGPQIPYLGKSYRSGKLRPKLETGEGLTQRSIPLDWSRWKTELGLDSMAYFQFTHPASEYRNSEPSPGGITQISPFVVEKGRVIPVEILYINEKPVYFSQAQQLQRYAFSVEPGPVKVQFRLKNRLITVNRINAVKGEKLVVSYNLDTLVNKSIQIDKASEKLSEYEASVLNKYMIRVSDTYSPRFATIRQPDNVFLLEPSITNRWNKPSPKLVGPLSYNQVEYQAKEAAPVSFLAEPDYTYTIVPGLIKQTSNADKYPFKTTLNTLKPQSYTDFVLINKEVDSLWSHYLDLRSHTTQIFNNAWLASKGNGSLTIKVKPSEPKISVPFIKSIIVYDNNNPDFLNIYPGRETNLGYLAPGDYRLLFLLKNDSYVLNENISIRSGGKTFIQVDLSKPIGKDSFILEIAGFIKKRSIEIDEEDKPALTLIKETFSNRYSDPDEYKNLMTGSVYSAKDKQPLAGVSVMVKGTRFGVSTDVQGRYSIKVPAKGKLVFNYIGYIPQELDITRGGNHPVDLAEDTNALEEVVVVGYGAKQKMLLEESLVGIMPGVSVSRQLSESTIMIRGNAGVGGNSTPLYIVDGVLTDKPVKDYPADEIAEISVLKDAAATAIYGSRGANGVIIITTKKAREKAQLDALSSAGADSVSIRNNFSDYAFWQPRLRTGKDGQARFHITLPDDMTNWRTFVIAMTDKAQTGYAENNIKAFKSLSAAFVSPRFAVQGDSFSAIGKIMNYTTTGESVTREFSYNGKRVLTGKLSVKDAHLDTLAIVAEQADSLAFRYTIQKDSGYSDGEERSIPVFKAGVLETSGRFDALEHDTTFTLSFNPELGPVTIRAEVSALPALLDETERLRNYEYLCNEQIASKLKALLVQKKIRTYLNQPFEHDKSIRQLIKKLDNGRRDDASWGWWKNTDSELWISRHALEAYIEAEKAGYSVPFKKQQVIDYLVHQISDYRVQDKLEAILLLKQIKAEADYKSYIALYEKEQRRSKVAPTLYDKFKLLYLKQQSGLPIVIDSLMAYKHSTMFGNMYFGDNNFKMFDNSILNTLLAYKIIKHEGKHPEWLSSIRNFLLEQRQDGYWRNTYESSLILAAILPDLLKESIGTATTLKLGTSGSEQISKFPYTTTVPADTKLQLQKSGHLPLYITAYQQYWNPQPEKVSKSFRVDTRFESSSGIQLTKLKGGEQVILRTEMDVSADADYVMVEIPIPAGCSYDEKEQSWWGNEVHREYAKNKVSVFCRKLKKGKYTFLVKLMPRYDGSFTLNPAKAEMMYFPVFYGREEAKKVIIGDAAVSGTK